MTTADLTAPASTSTSTSTHRFSPGRALAWTALVLVLLVTLFPFYWMLRTALSNGTTLATAGTTFLPVDFTWGAFRRVLGMASTAEAQAEGGSGTAIDFWVYLRNSVVTSSLITAGQVFFGALAAYAFARMRWPGRDAVFFVLLTALMVPPIFTQLPNFLLMRDLGILNTYAAIVLPMSWGPLITLALVQYVQAWNEYFWPLLVGSERGVRTLTVALGVFRSQTPQGNPDWPGLMAATLIAAIPVLVLFISFGRRIVDSIGFSGIK